MVDEDRSLRIRGMLDSWFVLVVLVLVIALALSGFWFYQTFFVDDFTEEDQLVMQWSESSEFEHSALIVNESIPFEVGERVENRPIYYTRLSDDLNVTYTYEYSAPAGDKEVNTEIVLTYRGMQGEDVLWTNDVPIASETESNLTPAENQTVAVDVNIREVFQTISTIEEQLGSAGSIEIIITAFTTTEGSVAGEDVTASHESSMDLSVATNTFRVTDVTSIDERHDQVETVDVRVDPSGVEQIGSILAVLVSLIFLVGLGYLRVTDQLSLSEDERELLRIQQQEAEFSEWITTGTFPSERDYEATVLVDDLEGLVDVAIDTNKRVIKDEQLGVSTVLDNEYIYIYVRPDSPASDWLINYADMTLEEFSQF